MKTIEHFVNGKSFSGSSKKTSDVFNPATGEISAKVNLATKKDVDDAVEIASKAFVTWSQVPPLQRARILFKFKELIEKVKQGFILNDKFATTKINQASVLTELVNETIGTAEPKVTNNKIINLKRKSQIN